MSRSQNIRLDRASFHFADCWASWTTPETDWDACTETVTVAIVELLEELRYEREDLRAAAEGEQAGAGAGATPEN